MPKYTEKDAGKDTDASQKEVSEAWHQAREDAQDAGELPEREANKEAQKEDVSDDKDSSSDEEENSEEKSSGGDEDSSTAEGDEN